MNSVSLSFDGDVGVLELSGTPTVAQLEALFDEACRDAFLFRGRHRVELRVPADIPAVRRALHRTGFRFEGVRRGGRSGPEGPVDEAQYARLSSDEVEGRTAFTGVMNAVLPRKRLIAHVLITDQAGRICVVETTFKSDWELPGGIVEPQESPRLAAIRETAEELSLAIEPAGVLVVDWLGPHLGWEDAVEVIFAGPVLAEVAKDAIVADPREIMAVYWLPLDEALPRFAPFARGRLAAAVAAAADGRCRYLERGQPVA